LKIFFGKYDYQSQNFLLRRLSAPQGAFLGFFWQKSAIFEAKLCQKSKFSPAAPIGTAGSVFG